MLFGTDIHVGKEAGGIEWKYNGTEIHIPDIEQGKLIFIMLTLLAQ